MKTPAFNRDREHSSIHPPYFGAMFNQSGAYFDGSGQFLFREGEGPEAGAGTYVPAPQPSPDTDPEPRLLPDLLRDAIADGNVTLAELEAIVAELGGSGQQGSADVMDLLKGALTTGSVSVDAVRAVLDDIAPQSGNQAPPPPQTPPVKPAPQPNVDVGEIDLAAWAKNEANYAFFSVRKVVSEQYPDIDTATTKSIVAGLITHGVVSEEDARRG